MANTVTWSGQTPEGLRRQIDRMPAVVEAQLRLGARSIAETLRRAAAESARTRDWHLANEIVTTEDQAQKAWVVSVTPRNPRPANLPLWLEFGTRHMSARPFFTPALVRARAMYPTVMNNALQAAFDATVNL